MVEVFCSKVFSLQELGHRSIVSHKLMLSQKHTFCMDMTVLERQQARFKWLLQHNYVNQYNSLESCSMPTDQFHGFVDHESMNGDIIDWKKKPEMYLGNNDLPKYGGFSLNGTGLVANNRMDFGQAEVAGSVEIDRCLSRTSSCQIGVVEAAKIEEKVVAIKVAEDLTLMENKQSNNGNGDNSNKRKAEVCLFIFTPSSFNSILKQEYYMIKTL